MPEAQNFGGFQGYSSQPMYQQAVDAHAAANPAQAAHLGSFTMNPVKLAKSVQMQQHSNP